MGCDNEELLAARDRAEEEHQRIGSIVNNLLDNLTADNREFVDGRLKELNDQRKQLELRLAELDRLAAGEGVNAPRQSPPNPNGAISGT